MKLASIPFGIALLAAGAVCGCSSDVAASADNASAQAVPTDAGRAQLVPANHFDLGGGELRVTYDRSDDGKTLLFVYADAQQTLVFTDRDVHVASTEAGAMVSVFLVRTIDTGSTTFSVLVPRVQLGAQSTESVQTHAITTIHRFSVVPPRNVGQLDGYAVTALQGTATHVDVVPVVTPGRP